MFVCMGNICRSPLAEGVFRHQAREAGVLDAFEIALSKMVMPSIWVIPFVLYTGVYCAWAWIIKAAFDFFTYWFLNPEEPLSLPLYFGLVAYRLPILI